MPPTSDFGWYHCPRACCHTPPTSPLFSKMVTSLPVASEEQQGQRGARVRARQRSREQAPRGPLAPAPSRRASAGGSAGIPLGQGHCWQARHAPLAPPHARTCGFELCCSLQASYAAADHSKRVRWHLEARCSSSELPGMLQVSMRCSRARTPPQLALLARQARLDDQQSTFARGFQHGGIPDQPLEPLLRTTRCCRNSL